MAQVVRLAAVRRLAVFRERRKLQDEARQLIERFGPERAGYVAALSSRLPHLSEAERVHWAVLADEIERAVGFGWFIPEADH